MKTFMNTSKPLFSVHASTFSNRMFYVCALNVMLARAQIAELIFVLIKLCVSALNSANPSLHFIPKVAKKSKRFKYNKNRLDYESKQKGVVPNDIKQDIKIITGYLAILNGGIILYSTNYFIN